MIFVKKILIWHKWAILVWKWHIVITLDPLEGFFEILHNERSFMALDRLP